MFRASSLLLLKHKGHSMLDVAKIATLNPSLLKEMSVAEVLELHPLIDAQSLEYHQVQKTKPIRAKPLSLIVIDKSVESKVLLATLEGNQDLKASSFVCWGVDNDVWQQSGDKLHAKYTPISVDANGWTLFHPKPDSPVNACQIEESEELGPCLGFSIENPSWGDQRVIDGKVKYLHYGVAGDYVMQGLNDAKDTYRIAQKFFDNTYEPV
jgi:hypothetical protein